MSSASASGVMPHRVLRLALGADSSAARCTPGDRLLLVRIDGVRTAAEVCDGGPADAMDALASIGRLVACGAVEIADDADGPAFSYFSIDPDHPPAGIGTVVPVPQKADDAEQPTKSSDYFLMWQVDGRTDVEQLAAVCGRTVGRTIQGLIELFHRGLVDFPPDFKRRYLVTLGGKGEATKEVSAETEALFVSLAGDPAFRAAGRRWVPAINSDADMARLDVARTEGYPLALVDGRHTVGEICDLSIRSAAHTTAFVLYLFHIGLVKLGPGEEAEDDADVGRPGRRSGAAPGRTAPAELVPPGAPAAAAPVAAAPPPPAAKVAEERAFSELELEWDDGTEEEGAADEAPDLSEFTIRESRAVLLTPPPPGASSRTPDEAAAAEEPTSYDSLPTLPAAGETGARPVAATAANGASQESRKDTGVYVSPASYVLPPVVDRRGSPPESVEGAVADAILAQAAAALTGRVFIRGGGAERTLWLEGGHLVAVDSTVPSEDLGLHLFQAGALKAEAYGAMEAARRMSGRSAAEVLAEQGALTRDEVVERCRGLDAAAVRAAAGAHGATIEATPGDLPVGTVRRSQTLAAVLGRAKAPVAGDGDPDAGGFTEPYRDVRPDALKALLVDHQDQHCIARRPAPQGLDGRERALFDLLAAGTPRLTEVLANSRLGKTKTRRLLYALYCEGYFEFDPSPGLLLDHDYDPEDLDDELDRQTEADMFRRLGLHLSATGEDVEAAYARIATHYDTAKALGRGKAVFDKVRRIREKVDEGFARLADDGARRAYRDEQAGGLRIAFHAEVRCRTGERLLLVGDDDGSPPDPASARRAFASAHDLAPTSARYLAWLALAQAHEAPPSKDPAAFQRARMTLERAGAAGPDDPTVQAIAAAFHRDFGSPDTAEAFASHARSLAGSAPESQPRLRALGI